MFDTAKAVNKARKMQSQVKKIQQSVFYREEKGDNATLVRGDKHIEELIIDGEERKDIKELLNEAFKQVDKKMEKAARNEMDVGEVKEMLGM